MVFFNWRHQKDQLVKHAEKRGITHAVIEGGMKDEVRDMIVQRFQGGHLQTVFLHPQTGAHGLTLTRGTRTIWSSPIYMADFLKQGNHRIYRGGQTQKTETILVEAEGTVEQLVYERLGEKTTRMVNLLEIIKEGRK